MSKVNNEMKRKTFEEIADDLNDDIKAKDKRIAELESLFKERGGCIKTAMQLLNEHSITVKELESEKTRMEKEILTLSKSRKKAIINACHCEVKTKLNIESLVKNKELVAKIAELEEKNEVLLNQNSSHEDKEIRYQLRVEELERQNALLLRGVDCLREISDSWEYESVRFFFEELEKKDD